MSFQQILATLLFLTMFPAGCKDARVASGEIVEVDREDQEMNAAMEMARQTVDQFLLERSKNPADFQGLLKVYFSEPQREKDGEHMWVQLLENDNGNFSGVLISSPAWLTNVKEGDIVEFDRSRISDWLYTRDGKARGAYTVQVLRKRMSPEERAAHDSGYPFVFD